GDQQQPHREVHDEWVELGCEHGAILPVAPVRGKSLAVASDDHGVDPATDVEVADDLATARAQGRDQVVEDAVGDGLVERALVPVAPQIELEALQLYALPVRNIDDADGGEVRLAGHRTHAGELGTVEADFVIAARTWIREGRERPLRPGRRARGQIGLRPPSHRGGASYQERLSGASHAPDLRGCRWGWGRVQHAPMPRKADPSSRRSPRRRASPDAPASPHRPARKEPLEAVDSDFGLCLALAPAMRRRGDT